MDLLSVSQMDPRRLDVSMRSLLVIAAYNTFYNTSPLAVVPTISYRDANFPNDPSNIVFRNNIVYGPTDSKVEIGRFMTDELFNIATPAMSFAKNCYFSPTGAPTFAIGSANGGSYGTLGGTYGIAEWQSQYGYDASSTVATPLFVDVSSGNFRLKPGRPCGNIGAFAAAEDQRIGIWWRRAHHPAQYCGERVGY